jgi:hypothetical protein
MKYAFVWVALVFFIGGCATVEGEWEKTKRINTIYSYKEFGKWHPEYQNKTKERIAALEEVEWEKALKMDTIYDYYNFLQTYSGTAHMSEISRRSMTIISRIVSDLSKDNVELIKVSTNDTLSFETFPDKCKGSIPSFLPYDCSVHGSESIQFTDRDRAVKVSSFEDPTECLNLKVDKKLNIIRYHSGTGLIIVAVRCGGLEKMTAWSFNLP